MLSQMHRIFLLQLSIALIVTVFGFKTSCNVRSSLSRFGVSPLAERRRLSKTVATVKVATASIHCYQGNTCLWASSNELVGEDAAAFSLEDQDLKAWGQFAVAVSAVLGLLFYVWLYEAGPHWGDNFVHFVEGLANGDTTWAITYMLGIFAVAHSGLASLRPFAEPIIGARPWRYVFALVSLPLAFTCVVYFINHRCYQR